MDVNTGQIFAALMTRQKDGDGEVLPELHDQIPVDTLIAVVGGNGAYDTRPCHAAIAARGATPSIPPRDGAAPWSKRTPGAAWRNDPIDVIGQSSRRDWNKGSGYHRRSLDLGTAAAFATVYDDIVRQGEQVHPIILKPNGKPDIAVEGTDNFCVIRSCLDSLRKQGPQHVKCAAPSIYRPAA